MHGFYGEEIRNIVILVIRGFFKIGASPQEKIIGSKIHFS
jgi:hypothetical protein